MKEKTQMSNGGLDQHLRANLIVWEPTERFVNFLNERYFSHDTDVENHCITVFDYEFGIYNGIIGCAAKAWSEKLNKWELI